MKVNKSQKEAVLRAHQSIEEDQQDQEKLYRPAADKTATGNPAEQLNQSDQNKIKTWHNLRKMDVELAKKNKKQDFKS